MPKTSYKSEDSELGITINLPNNLDLKMRQLDEIEVRNLVDGVMIIATGKNRKVITNDEEDMSELQETEHTE